MVEKNHSKIILGTGLYALYSAFCCGEKGQHIKVLECDSTLFRRATFINQAHVYKGYHYTRYVYTAMKSAWYFERSNRDFNFCINREFKKKYATSTFECQTNSNNFCSNSQLGIGRNNNFFYFNHKDDNTNYVIS